jgi:predicted DCC family thiol-disulfide oxidoreductase YuxK
MNDKHVVVFDGICNLCSWSVKFIIRRDHKGVFQFTALQSKTGSQLLSAHGIQAAHVDTILLIKGGVAYTKSDAVFEIIAEFNPAWKALLVFRVIPKSIRDVIYGAIAQNRYRVFGKKDQYMVPSPHMMDRFLD